MTRFVPSLVCTTTELQTSHHVLCQARGSRICTLPDLTLPAAMTTASSKVLSRSILALTMFAHSWCLLMRMQVIVVMDPATSSKPRLHMTRMSTSNAVPPKEKRYVFDKAYDGNTDNRTLYYGTVKVQDTAGLAKHVGCTCSSDLRSSTACLLVNGWCTCCQKHQVGPCWAALDKQSCHCAHCSSGLAAAWHTPSASSRPHCLANSSGRFNPSAAQPHATPSSCLDRQQAAFCLCVHSCINPSQRQQLCDSM